MLSAELDRLRESLSCINYRGDQHTDILIEETDVLAKLRKVILITQNGNWISINPDKGRGKSAKMSPLLAVSDQHLKHGHHCACDNVIFLIRDEKLTIIYIDLKSNNSDGYEKQFQSTPQFVRYAIGLIKEFYSQELAIAEERYVIFTCGKTKTLNKTTTVAKSDKLNKTTPRKAYKREVSNGEKVYLKELLS